MTGTEHPRAETALLRADVETLEALLRRERDELAAARARLSREAGFARAESEAVDAAVQAFGDAAGRAKALEELVDAARAEGERLRAGNDAVRGEIAREAAAVQGLLARLVAVADALGDADLRRWARRAMRAEEAP